jgi:hypothetical protein
MTITLEGGITFFGITLAPPPPPENTAAWFGGGGFTPSQSTERVDRITFATDTATASVRGPLSLAINRLVAVGNFTDGWFGGGAGFLSTVGRITYATDTATASVRGPLSLGRRDLAAAGNDTDGWFGAGYNGNSGDVSRVDRITYATDTATASVRGPLSSGFFGIAAAGNSTNGWFSGGYFSAFSSVQSTVQRITYATDTATASVRGPLSGGRYWFAAAGNTTDGWFSGGNPAARSTVQRITYATDTATASVRGPLSEGRYGIAAAGNSEYGWFGAGYNQYTLSNYSLVDRITYATDTVTTSVRGPLSIARYWLAAAGGIQ